MADLEEDLSADTARFAAFVQRQDEQPPWRMRAPGSRIALLAAIVVAVAVVVALAFFFFA